MQRVLFSAVCTFLSLFPLFCQQTPSGPSFEVASVKPNTSGDNNSSMNTNNGEMLIRNSTLKNIIQNAYNVREYSFSGPDWLSSVRFDVSARFPQSDSKEMSKEERQEMRRVMLQNLLAERFKLEVHRETKTLSGYALLVSKKGARLKDSERKEGMNSRQNNGTLEAEGMTMANLANVIAGELRGPVADMTSLTGRYDLRLEWSRDEAKPTSDGDGKSVDTRPSIFTALQETLGLRVETKKIPVEILVVDRVERIPSEN
ncbi:MAG TPA: TIGR03435 family protein [Bryobacteraceae bacterium]|nr:TIGR03435 family protein [Bryobacteraceae bacterium]